jgi:hypothetical protein
MLTVHITKDYGGFNVRFSSDDAGAFRLAIESLKSFIRPDCRTYNPRLKQWRVSSEAAFSLQRWSAYCRNTLHAQAEWIDDGEMYEDEYADSYSHKAPPRRPRGVESEHEAYQVLHLLPSAPAPLIKAAYRELAKIKHPDHGGDDEEMKRINSAFDVLKGRLAA